MRKLLISLLLFIFTTFMLWWWCDTYLTAKETLVTGTIYEHNVTRDNLGDRIYSTIIITDDGRIVEKVGLSFYIKPAGSKVQYVETKLTWK